MPTKKEVKYDLAGSDNAALFKGMTSFIHQKGFCTVKTGLSQSLLTSAADEVKKLKLDGQLHVPVHEIVDGLLGSEGSTEIMEVAPEVPGEPKTSLQELASALSSGFGDKLSGIAQKVLGFNAPKKSDVLLNLTGEPADEDEPPALTDDECQKWLSQFTTHRIMLVLFIGPGQGEFQLEPFQLEESQPLVLTTEPGMMVALRPDMLTHRHYSARETTALTLFLMEDKTVPLEHALVTTPTTDVLVSWVMDRVKAIKAREIITADGPKTAKDVPQEWLSTMNKTYAQGDQVAIRSFACKMPGTWDPHEFWYTSVAGTDWPIEVPFLRWDVAANYDPDPNSYKQWKTCSKHCSYMEGLWLFDNKFFGLSPAETRTMDPQQRHILETSYDALSGAGFTKKTLSRSLIGVYLGCSVQMEWAQMPSPSDGGGADGSATTGGAASINSNRISFCLGMQGPSYTIDVQAASSAVAMTHAYNGQKFQTDRYSPCHTAICGGMYLSFVPQDFIMLSSRGLLNPVGRTCTFDATSAGYVKGEGLGAVAISTLGSTVDGQLVADDKPFMGTMAGAGNGHYGTAATLIAVNGPKEQELVAGTIRQAGLTGLDIDAVDVHGDGLPMNDAMEVAALNNAARWEIDMPLVVSSIKTNAGQTGATCALSQFLKVLYSIRGGVHVGGLHMMHLNPHIEAFDEERAPMVFNTELLPMTGQGSYYGLTSRSVGGAICHVITYATPTSKEDKTVKRSQVPPAYLTYWPGGGGKLEANAKASSYSIVGSWTNFETLESMEKESKDVFAFTVTLGVNNFEHFQIVLDGEPSRVIHPTTPNGLKFSHILGPTPSSDCVGLNWIIDGREKVPDGEGVKDAHPAQEIGAPGDMYKVRVRVSGKYRNVEWEKLPTSGSAGADTGEYYVVSSWNGFAFDEPMSGSGGTFTATVCPGTAGGRFQIVRNKDWSQAFFPGADGAAGPGDAAFDRCFALDGKAGDIYRITFKRTGSSSTVSSEKVDSKPAAALPDPIAPHYFMTTGGVCHEMQRTAPFVYAIGTKLTGQVPFQILRDGDFRRVFYPSVNNATANSIHKICGPGLVGSEKYWLMDRDIDDTDEEGGWYHVQLTVSPVDLTPVAVTWRRDD